MKINFILNEIKRTFKYGDPLFIVCSCTLLVGGLWFLYWGIFGLIK